MITIDVTKNKTPATKYTFYDACKNEGQVFESEGYSSCTFFISDTKMFGVSSNRLFYCSEEWRDSLFTLSNKVVNFTAKN